MGEGANAELEAVKGDVRALRHALEAARDEATTAAQRAHARASSRGRPAAGDDHRAREEMVRQHEDFLATQRAAERDEAAEVEQLRAAIVAARRQADELQQQHDATLAEQARRFDVERRELHDTITELRRRLETAAMEARR